MEPVFYFPRELMKGNPLLVDFLSEKEQGKYEVSIDKYTGKAKDNLNTPQNASNLLKILQLNQAGIPTATIPEIISAARNGMNLSKVYVDGREVLLSGECSYVQNKFLAEQLIKKLKLTVQETPYIIKGLGIRQSDSKDAYYGLEFITKNAEVISTSDFHHKNNGRKFSTINPDYSIEFDKNGKYTLFTRDNILSRLCVNRDRGLNSRNDHLADSYGNGRVVVITSAEGAQKFLQES
ncbi:MAG: hypothetical protein AABX16_02240 [Nanoarchaeota archaeon]